MNWSLAVLLWLVVTGVAGAQPEVSATLSTERAVIGEPVELRVEINGSTNAQAPRSVTVDGLNIVQTGRSTQVQMQNFQMSTSTILSYRVLPLQEGSFEIPPFTVQVDGREYLTSRLTLEVAPGQGRGQGQSMVPPTARAVPVVPGQSGSAPPPGQSATPDPNARLAFAELVIPREKIFVGEVVPVEIRFYFNKSRSFRLLQDQPDFSGEGFTVEDLTAPQKGEQVVDGTAYNVLSFQSAITAVKSGELEIPSVKVPVVVQVPSQMPGGFDGFFGQFFGGSGFSDSEQLTVASDPARLTVQRLPKEGRPENFGGAIGDFTMTVDASPETAAPGDPVTMDVVVDGRGNFSAMGQPALENADGWKLYPPADSFDAADSVGFGGAKTFEFMMVAKSKQTETPRVVFSYFDPAQEKYETLMGGSIPVVAEADPSAVASVPAESAAANEDGDAVAEAKAPEVVGRSGVLSDLTERSFVPPHRSFGFIVLNVLGAAGVLGLVGFYVRRQIRSGEGARRAELARRHSELMAELQQVGLDDEHFLRVANEDLGVLASRDGLSEPNDLLRSGRLTSETREGLGSLLGRIDEQKFASGIAVGVDESERGVMIEALRALGSGK
ncbi:MAG: BatD family protein [Chthoniobacterales bacterium]